MTSEELESLIVMKAAALGIWWHHEHDSRRSPRGWVDLSLLGNRGGLFIECKNSGGDRPTEAQIEVGIRMRKAGLPYRLWTPRHWYDGTITKELEDIA